MYLIPFQEMRMKYNNFVTNLICFLQNSLVLHYRNTIETYILHNDEDHISASKTDSVLMLNTMVAI